MTHKSTWKNLERQTARELDGRRASCSGNALPDKTDVELVSINGHEITVSCKYRASMAVVTEWREAKENAEKVGKIAMLILKTKYLRGQLVVLHMDDFKELLK